MPKSIICPSEHLRKCFVHVLINTMEVRWEGTAGSDRMQKAEDDDGFINPALVLPGPGLLVHADCQQSVYLLKNQ